MDAQIIKKLLLEIKISSPENPLILSFLLDHFCKFVKKQIVAYNELQRK